MRAHAKQLDCMLTFAVPSCRYLSLFYWALVRMSKAVTDFGLSSKLAVKQESSRDQLSWLMNVLPRLQYT